MQDAPADGTEDPFAEEERAADRNQGGREQRQPDDPGNENRDPLELLGDRLDFGLEEVAMCDDKPTAGRDDPADAGPEPRLTRGRGRPGRRRSRRLAARGRRWFGWCRRRRRGQFLGRGLGWCGRGPGRRRGLDGRIALGGQGRSPSADSDVRSIPRSTTGEVDVNRRSAPGEGGRGEGLEPGPVAGTGPGSGWDQVWPRDPGPSPGRSRGGLTASSPSPRRATSAAWAARACRPPSPRS